MATRTQGSQGEHNQQALRHVEQSSGRSRKGMSRGERKAPTERLTLDLDRDLYQRVKVVAAQQHVSMRALIEGMLQEQLPSLELISRFPEGRLQPVSQASVARLAAAQEAIMRGRRFSDSSADLIREARDERNAGLDAGLDA